MNNKYKIKGFHILIKYVCGRLYGDQQAILIMESNKSVNYMELLEVIDILSKKIKRKIFITKVPSTLDPSGFILLVALVKTR